MEKRAESTHDVGMQAILVGCNNYPNPDNQLRGCHNDVHMMRKTLIERFRFDPKRIVVMIDNPGSDKMPTGENIKKELNQMITKARMGDRLFFYFAGHGLCSDPEGKTRKPSAIVACDYNNITCMDFRYYVNRLPKNATFTILADSCCSGGLIDKEPVQVGPPYHIPNPRISDDGYKPRMITYESYLKQLSSVTGLDDPEIGAHLIQLFRSEASILYRKPPHQHPKPLKPDQGILLSGGEPNEETEEDPKDGSNPEGGSFTKTIVAILKRHPSPITNKQLVIEARGVLGNKKAAQHPCLYCSRENADAVFLRKAAARADEIGEASSLENDA